MRSFKSLFCHFLAFWSWTEQLTHQGQRADIIRNTGRLSALCWQLWAPRTRECPCAGSSGTSTGAGPSPGVHPCLPAKNSPSAEGEGKHISSDEILGRWGKQNFWGKKSQNLELSWGNSSWQNSRGIPRARFFPLRFLASPFFIFCQIVIFNSCPHPRER